MKETIIFIDAGFLSKLSKYFDAVKLEDKNEDE